MSVELDATAGVDHLGQAMAEAIADLPAYESFKDAEAAVRASDEAQERIEAFESRRDSFMAAKQRGEATQADVQEIETLRQELYELEVMQEYREARDRLDQQFAQLNQILTDELGVDFAGAASSCCLD